MPTTIDDIANRHPDYDEDDPENLRVPSDQVDWRMWPIAGVVAKRLGVTKRELAQMVTEREINRYRAKDGTWRFDPRDVDAIIRASRIGAKDMAAAEIDAVVASSSDRARAPESAVMGAMLSAANTQIKQLQDHVETVMKLAVDGAAKALTTVEGLCGRLAVANEDLTAKLHAKTELAERAQTETWYRDVAMKQLTATEQRKEALAQLIMQKAAPVLLAKATGAPIDLAALFGKPKAQETPPGNGHSGPSQDQVVATIALLKSVRADNPELFRGLLEADGFFTEAQRQYVRTIVGEPEPSGTPAADNPKPKEADHA